jgi:hypothetical protein
MAIANLGGILFSDKPIWFKKPPIEGFIFFFTNKTDLIVGGKGDRSNCDDWLKQEGRFDMLGVQTLKGDN